jgi:hypothetical protein
VEVGGRWWTRRVVDANPKPGSQGLPQYHHTRQCGESPGSACMCVDIT